jgi:hypothetical protein
MSHARANLSIAVSAAKEQARALVFESRRRGTAPSDQCMSVYLALIVMHRELQDDRASIDPFVPQLKHAILECDDSLGAVKAPARGGAARGARRARRVVSGHVTRASDAPQPRRDGANLQGYSL